MTPRDVHMPSTKAALSRRMSRRAILRIGTEKAGGATLQRFLSANRDRLAAQGFAGQLRQAGAPRRNPSQS